MIQAIIGGGLLLLIYRFMTKDSEYDIDWWMAGVFIFAPVVLIFLAQIVLAFFDLPLSYVLLGYVLYFVIPYLMLAKGLEFSTKDAVKFSVPVPIIAITLEFLFYFLVA